MVKPENLEDGYSSSLKKNLNAPRPSEHLIILWGERGATTILKPEEGAPVTKTTLRTTDPAPAECRQRGTPSVPVSVT